MSFPSLLIQACQLALERGIFYQDQFANFVLDCCGFGCTAHLLGHVVIACDIENRAQHDRELFTRLEEQVKLSPRGAYVTVERQFRDAGDAGAAVRRTFRTIVSDGTGKIATGGKYDFYDTIPAPEVVLRAVVNHEIYECRKYCERLKLVTDGQRAIRRFGLQVGKRYANVVIPGNPKPYTSVTIANVNFEHGEIRLYLSRPGASAKATTTMSAYDFAAYAGLDKTHAQLSSLRIPAADDLFASLPI